MIPSIPISCFILRIILGSYHTLMAAGCPVIASNRTSLPEIGGDASEYFDPSSPKNIGMAIHNLWHDGLLRQRLIERGKRRALNFSATELAQQHLAVFREAIESFSKARYAWNYWIYQRYYHILIHLKYWKSLPQFKKNTIAERNALKS